MTAIVAAAATAFIAGMATTPLCIIVGYLILARKIL